MIKKEIIEITIDDIDFKIQEFNWKKSLQIQKKVGEIITPVLNVLALKSNDNEDDDKKSLLDKLEIQNLGSSIKDCLFSIENPFKFFKEIFSKAYIVKTNKSGEKGDVCLDTDEILNETFHKKTITAFKLVFEVLKVNELLFSNGLGGLGKIIGTLMSTMQK